MTVESFFDEIESHYNSKLPFVVYRKGNVNNIFALLQRDEQLYTVDDFSESGFVMAPFNEDQSVVYIPLNKSKRIENLNFEGIEDKNLKTYSSNLINAKENYINLVSRAINSIKNKHFEKVVLSRKESIKIDSIKPLELFKRLLSAYSNAFVYCWFHPKTGFWLGATPETLLSVENNKFSTMSLAGTKPFEGTLNVSWSSKEIEEQKIVTDFITSQLDNEINDLQKSEVETAQAGSLVHLKTIISGVLKNSESNLKSIINKLHPTPAVCGFPREAAKDFIFQNEAYNREFYTGFLGELNFKEQKSRSSNKRNVENKAYKSVKNVTNLFVNLRCMQLNENLANVYIGGGITIDSRPEKEWQETVAKSNTIKKVL